MARRGENIRYRKDGRWEARYRVTDPVTGKRKSRSLYAKTYAAAKQKRLDELSIHRANLSENTASSEISAPADFEGCTDGCAIRSRMQRRRGLVRCQNPKNQAPTASTSASMNRF
ncbi:MAG: hypothetical protein IJ567_00150 [Lachnospiraceae bacterium]|nr:hypothetical protein [Lachnospiraceae bacterium]